MDYVGIPGTHLRVSRIGLGTGDWGAGRSGDDARRILEAYLSAGGNMLDSAHCYAFWLPGGEGKSERTVGELVRGLGVRKEVIIATKGGHCDGGPAYPRPGQCLQRGLLERDIQQSLDRLAMEQVDLYYLHRDDGITPVDEVMETLNGFVQRGWVRHIGASNWSTGRMEQANAVAMQRGWQGFCASQVQWSLARPKWTMLQDPVCRYATEADQAWYIAAKLPVVAYTATAGGLFSKGIGAGDFDTPENHQRYARAKELAAKLGCTPGQIALAWLLQQKVVTIALTGTGNTEHLRESLGATRIVLTAEQMTWLANQGT